MLTFSDTDPKINPAQEEALRTDSSLTRDTTSICQVKIVARGNIVCFGSSNFRTTFYLVDVT